ncbi:peptidase M1-like protein [Dyadobacter jejuensis]|uniref:Peptidase M1-like protein n=1 Tax=Dyadobacter jejuensis TaxID=1082580 RepID=A0A316APY5_9BACT|nr:M1 family metallopeptidase [Dyadobacter jejuensis]PWJ59642.1 peptidase M1-like protein [Dyadobacter jejuensis]
MFRLLSLFLVLLITIPTFAQKRSFTRADTLRGAITAERAWWDLTYYHLSVTPNPQDSTLQGSNLVGYTPVAAGQRMQIDLQEPMQIDQVTQHGKPLTFAREGNAYWITLEEKQQLGQPDSLLIRYSGRPRLAKNPPWDGGVQWKIDANGLPYIATSCQGLGASVWWPCKDHMYDEADSMRISIRAPKGVSDVSNGQLESTTTHTDGSRTFTWVVRNPINNYGVNMNIADYVSWEEVYDGEKGLLKLGYYARREDEEKARKQYQQVPQMLKAFEHWFGPYPFYEDGYKIVQVPYLGMEHQSSVTYGNQFANGYLGRDLSKTGWGLKWDFIIVHESGHEWFANNITYRDAADMWIHESFTNYSESLYTEYYYGKEAGADYVIGTRANIANDIPIIGVYGVNQEGSKDMYYKGGNMLHTIRQLVANDQKWRQILRGLNQEFYHQTVTSAQIENYVSQKSGMDLSKVFDQYLRDIRIPTLEYRPVRKGYEYRWTQAVDGFEMPIKIQLGGKTKSLRPTSYWKKVKGSGALTVDRNYYVRSKEV